MYTVSAVLLAASLVPSGALGMKSVLTADMLKLNDWAKPCTTGRCAYTSGNGKDTAFNQFIISGSSASLSDLTEAAGWTISDCPPEWSEGEITVQITCEGTEEQTTQCNSLFEGDAVDTIVRLPENCGMGPFSRIVSITTSSSKFRRRNNVYSVVMDYNFAAIQTDRGPVEFAVATSNVEEISSSLLATNDLLNSFISGSSSGSAFPNATSGGLVSRWEKTHQFDIPPLKVDENFHLFDTSIDCPAPADGGAGFSASVNVDTHVYVDTQVAFGFTIAGKIFPPKLTKMQVIGSLNGQAGADFTVNARAKGVFDTGSIPIWDAGLPGASIPGILSVGPSFGIHGKLTADVGVEAEVKTGVKWEFPQLHMAFPQDSGEQIVDAVQVSTPFTLSLDPKIQATGNVHAELVPRIDLGVKVLSGLAEATVYLDLEASADLNMKLDGSADVGASAFRAASFDGEASAQASGCASLNAGVKVNAGARGAIWPIFDKDIEYELFNKGLTVFDKCFGASTEATPNTSAPPPPGRKRSYAERRATLSSRDLVCPDLSLGALAEVLNL